MIMLRPNFFAWLGFFSILFLTIPLQSTAVKIQDSDLLMVGFDGIGYETVMEMYRGGYFRDFQPPIPMVATFPSISDPNWAQIMSAPVEPSYTKAHFLMSYKDRNGVGKEVGNILKHITYTPAFEKKFNYKTESPLEHAMNVVWTKTTAHYWIDDLERTLLEQKNPKSPFSAFVVNTDFISHVSGKKETLKYLKFTEGKLKDLRKKYHEKFKRTLDFIIVSDHGNDWVEPKGIDLKPLEKFGWHWNSQLAKPTEYAFVAPEIIAFGAFYVLPKQEKKFAQDLAKLKGIHVTLALEKENVINVYSKSGATQISINPEKRKVGYKVLRGEDSLKQIALFKKTSGPNNSIVKSIELSWDEYFYSSQSTDFPNSLVNAWEGFYKNAKNPAPVLAAAERGYAFTNMTLEILTYLSGLHAMHGSFHKSEVYGVFMSTRPIPVEYIRPWEVRQYLK